VQNLVDNLQKHVTFPQNGWLIPQKQVFMSTKVFSVIKMKSPDTIVYEQDSQMALSCFHYDSVSFPMQKKKSGLGETT